MAVNWVGVAGMIVFYLVILVIGIWAARKTKGAENSERVIIADRKFGWAVSICTLTATWVGGGLVNGTAEMIFNRDYGLIWAQAAYITAIAFFINGTFFAKKMRDANYITMLDPFVQKYGVRMAAMACLCCLFGEILYCAAILTALGSSISVILNIDRVLAVVVSSCIAAFYTFFGGIWSVAYTDLAQLGLIIFGLWLCIPFSLTNPAVSPISETQSKWTGEWDPKFTWVWIDLAFLILLGSLPWQVYYQRVFASMSSKVARYSSFAASLGIIICTFPSYMVGIIGASTNWEETSIDLNKTDIYANPALILPAVLQYLTPAPVAFFGLGAVSAAVMSSTDSSFLSLSTMFSRLIYRNLCRSKASERELIWVMRLAIPVIATISCVIALVVQSTYGLLIMCADLVYVVLVPQMICIFYAPFSNTYGASSSYMFALVFRLLSGETSLNWPPVIQFPLFEIYHGVPTQFFPFRTFIMFMAIVVLVVVSYAADVIFRRGWLGKKWDIFRCFLDDEKENISAIDVQEKSSPMIRHKSSVEDGVAETLM